MGSHVFLSPRRPLISDQRCEGDLTGVIELPAENVQRWTALRKAAVVNAVTVGEVTREEICRRYQISIEELLSWQRAYQRMTTGSSG
jgi:transposase-like protein